MYGKVCNLEKPMVIIKKHKKVCANDDKMQVDNVKENFQTEYLVKSVIRKKILFNKRPKPIVF